MGGILPHKMLPGLCFLKSPPACVWNSHCKPNWRANQIEDI